MDQCLLRLAKILTQRSYWYLNLENFRPATDSGFLLAGSLGVFLVMVVAFVDKNIYRLYPNHNISLFTRLSSMALEAHMNTKVTANVFESLYVRIRKEQGPLLCSAVKQKSNSVLPTSSVLIQTNKKGLTVCVGVQHADSYKTYSDGAKRV